MNSTITLPLWPFVVLPATYLVAGIVTWLPLVWQAYRTLEKPPGTPPFWRFAFARPQFIPVQIVLWPLAAWEYLR